MWRRSRGRGGLVHPLGGGVRMVMVLVVLWVKMHRETRWRHRAAHGHIGTVPGASSSSSSSSSCSSTRWGRHPRHWSTNRDQGKHLHGPRGRHDRHRNKLRLMTTSRCSAMSGWETYRTHGHRVYWRALRTHHEDAPRRRRMMMMVMMRRGDPTGRKSAHVMVMVTPSLGCHHTHIHHRLR